MEGLERLFIAGDFAMSQPLLQWAQRLPEVAEVILPGFSAA